MANYTPSQVYDKYVALQKQLATNINNKGVTASQTELYDNLIDKVAQIENLKGEERTLENFTNVLDEPKSIVQLEYPEPKNLFDINKAELTNAEIDGNGIKYTGSAGGDIDVKIPAGSYTLSFKRSVDSLIFLRNGKVTSGIITQISNTATSVTFNFTGTTDGYLRISCSTQDLVLSDIQIEKGSTATTYEPYPAPKTLNAKLGSKNLFDKSTLSANTGVSELTQTANGFTFKTTATSKTMSVSSNIYLPAGTYYCSGTVTCSDTSYKGGWGIYDKDNKIFIINSSDKGTINGAFTITESKTYSLNFYAPYKAPVGVVMTFENVQLEIGTTATSYTPYISDFSTVNVIRCGKNLSHNLADRTDIFLTGTPTTVYSFSDNDIIKSFAVNGYATDYHITEFANNNGVITFKTSNVSYTAGVPVNVESGKTYTVSANIIGGVGGTAPIWISFMNNGLFVSYETKLTFTVPEGVNQGIFLIRPAAANSTCTFSNFQLELGSTATEYEPYSGQTYTPTSSGEVTGITNLYPLTTLVTNNAGVVFTEVTGGIYKEILPSTDKNGMTKVLQPAVDSTIDSNITSDNIKQGVNILGVTGDYICNYTYDETSKELVLLI